MGSGFLGDPHWCVFFSIADVDVDNDVNVDANNDITSGSAQTESLLPSTLTTHLQIISNYIIGMRPQVIYKYKIV